MSYHSRALSPGGRKLANPGRVSDSLTDPYYAQRHNSYTSPRSSVGVIPISTQTFVNIAPPAQSARERPSERVDAYSGRPRRSSLIDPQRGPAAGSSVQSSTRSRPTVVHDLGRPRSPQKGVREIEYYVTPAVSKEPRKMEHKKLYSVDDGTVKLVADVDVPAGGDRYHRSRESGDTRPGYRTGGVDRGRRGYHANGEKATDKDIDDEGAYSYTDPASMYRDTEPRWRDARPRRGSMDRGGASRERERPISVIDPALTYDPHRSIKDILGPPPSTRGWGRMYDGMSRAKSVREAPARVAQSPVRGRYAGSGASGDPRDPYYVAPRTSSNERRNAPVPSDRTVDRHDDYAYEDRREPRRQERRNSPTRAGDRSVERRGFGIRADSQDRYGRASDESFEQYQRGGPYRDSGYAERRDTVQDIAYQDERRLEQEKKDRLVAQQVQNDERDRQYERETREKEARRRQEDRGYEREQEREREPERDRDRERHTQRRDTKDREFRKDDGLRGTNEPTGQAGLATAATGGLAGAAAAFGLNKILSGKDKDKDKDREPERDRNRDRERERESERRYDEPLRSEDRERVQQLPHRVDERDRAQQAPRVDERERPQPPARVDDRDRPQLPARADERERAQQPPRLDDRDRIQPPARVDDRDRPQPPPRVDERDRLQQPPRVPGSFSEDAPFEQRDRERSHLEQDRGLGFAFENLAEPAKAVPSRPDRTPDGERKRVEERDLERQNEDKHVELPNKPAIDADEDYRRRMEQVQRELGRPSDERGAPDSDPDRERRRREREQRQREREDRDRNGDVVLNAGVGVMNEQAPPPPQRRSLDDASEVGSQQTASTGGVLRRKRSILDEPMPNHESAQIIDNSLSEKRENRVRIVDPPTEEEERRPRGILKKPTQKFPEHPNTVREGVAPLKDASKNGIPPGARWTKIDRRLVNPEALEEFKERFEERLDCVIVLRVLTKEEIQKLADRTRELRDERYEEERAERKATRRHDRAHDRNNEHGDESEDEYAERTQKMLEAPSTTAGASSDSDFIRDGRDRRTDRDKERDPQWMSGGLGRRE